MANPLLTGTEFIANVVPTGNADRTAPVRFSPGPARSNCISLVAFPVVDLGKTTMSGVSVLSDESGNQSGNVVKLRFKSAREIDSPLKSKLILHSLSTFFNLNS